MIERPTLTITRGLPGSGKTYEAKRLLAADTKLVRVNRDEAIRMLFGRWRGDDFAQQAVTTTALAAMGDLLRAGISVVSDDTNLPDERVVEFIRFADHCRAELRIIDLRSVDLYTCRRRNALRPLGDRVPDEKILYWDRLYQLDRFRPILPAPDDHQEGI